MRTRGYLLPFLSGLLLALCFPPFHLLLPSFVALVPLALHLRALPGDAGGRRSAFRAGAVTGVVYFGLLLHWLIPALLWLSPLGPSLYLVVVLLLGGLLGIVGWAGHGLMHGLAASRVGSAGLIGLPLAWTAGEWLRASLPGGLAFPWLGLGTSLTAYPELVGFAELVGARGVTFWLAAVNVLVAECVWRGVPGRIRRRIRRWAGTRSGARRDPGKQARGARSAPVMAALAFILLVPPAWSVWRADTLPTFPVARVVLAQTRVSAEVKADPERALEVTRAQLRDLGFGDGRRSFRSPDLLVWPETTFPFALSSRMDPVRSFVRATAAEEEAAVLFGALEEGVETEGSVPADQEDGSRDGAIGSARKATEYNAAFLFADDPPFLSRGDPRGGRELRSVYRKRFLVPLVERAPRLLPGFVPLPESLLEELWPGEGGDGGDGRLSAGGPATPVPIPGGNPSGPRFGILVCFESAFATASREYRRAGGDFLVNVTNDVWFGEDTWLPSRAGVEQHAVHVVMRAIENRMGVARSANGGLTFFVDPIGRIHGRAPEGRPGASEGTVRGSGVVTFYARTGDWVGLGSAGATLLLLLSLGTGPPGRRKEG